MTYTADSSFLSAPIGNAPIWANAIRPHNAGQADAIAAAYFDAGAAIGLNADLAISQGIHESGWFTSDHWRTQFNPCGLGVTGPGVPGATFATITDGVRAHYEHLVCYTMAVDPPVMAAWGMLDPRHLFHLARPTVAGLEMGPKWAVPGDGYTASIVAIANQVTGGIAPMPTNDYPTEADLGFPVRIETTDFVGPQRALTEIDWYVIHDTEGHFEGDIAVLTHGSKNGSVHFIVGREPGQFVASVPIRTTAWTAGNDTLGMRAIQFELSKAPDETGYTDWQYAATAAAIRWCQKQGVTVPIVYLGLHPQDADNGPLPDERGMIGHAGVPDGHGGWGGFAHHTDPGPDFDWPRFVALIGNAPAPPAPPKVIVSGYELYGASLAVWQRCTEPLTVLGNPVGDEVTAVVRDADGTVRERRVRQFERVWVIWQPENAAPWDAVCALATQRIEVKQ